MKRIAGAVALALVATGAVGSRGQAVTIGDAAARDGAAVQTFDPLRVEIRGASTRDGVPWTFVTGDHPERFDAWRRGPQFSFFISGLPTATGNKYDFELSFAKPIASCASPDSMFVTYASGEGAPSSSVADGLDICASGSSLGIVKGLSVRVVGATLNQRRILLSLAATAGEARISYIRIGPQGSLDDNTAKEINPDASRNDPRAGTADGVSIGRLTDFTKLRVQETPLGRFGSRFLVSPAPQKLGWRQSVLGTDATDLSEMLIVVRRGATVRALPFTDRYPLFDVVDQADSPIGTSFMASDPILGLNVRLDLYAPFYPQDETATTTPAVYADLTLTNPQGVAVTDAEVLVARPVGYDSRDPECASCSPRTIPGGVAWAGLEATGPSSRPIAGEWFGGRTVRVEEAIVAEDIAGTAVAGDVGPTGMATSAWLWGGGTGAGIPFREEPVYERRSRGHAGLTWTPGAIAGGSSATKRLVLAGYTSDEVARVDAPSGHAGLYKFAYASRFAGIESVVASAIASRGADIAKALAFAGLITDPSKLDIPGGDGPALRELLVLGFRSYVINTWILDRTSGSAPERWFSVWEGSTPCCRFHSTVDVVYNDAQLLLALWPQLLDRLLDQWVLFKSGSGAATVILHDIGINQVMAGQAYIPMPVEENANWILLAYAHWKATGDAAALATRMGTAKELISALAASDTDGDGLPDVGTTNTIDFSTDVLFKSKNQIYLGVKTASAAQAFLEAADATGENGMAVQMAARLRNGVAHTLENAAWRGDHFAISLDEGYESNRNARSIYAPNGLLYLYQFGGDIPLSPGLIERMKTDAVSAHKATNGPVGTMHMEVDVANGWASQDIWRDAVASYMGAKLGSGDFLGSVTGYRDMQKSYARTGDGGWWDIFVYGYDGTELFVKPDGKGRHVLGFYPRGGSAFVFLPAALGVTIDRHNGVLGRLPPGRPGSRAPLFALADWGSGMVPIATATTGGVSISGASISVTARDPVSPVVNTPGSVTPPAPIGLSVDGLTSPATLSVGHAGTWFATEVTSSAVVNWGDGDIPDGAANVCAMELKPRPHQLNHMGCAPLGVDRNIPVPANTWYLAEGSTDHGFESYVLIENPGGSPATVNITYMTPSGPVPRQPLVVPGHARRTIVVADDLPAEDQSTLVQSDRPVVVERAMYWRESGVWREGHAALGTTRALTNWYLPEGSTAHGFTTFALIQNPGDLPSDVALQLSAEDGRSATANLTVPPRSRRTVNLGDVLADGDVATKVTSSRPVVVERAQYWMGIATGGGSGSGGMVQPSMTWYLAEGSSAGPYKTFVLLQNPNSSPVAVNLVYNTPTGPVARQGFSMPPNSRKTITLADDLPGTDASFFIQASRPILAERSMFRSPEPATASTSVGGHVSGGAPAPFRRWNLAEGSTAHGLVEWVLIQNPGSTPANVSLFLQPSEGPTHTVNLVAMAGTRFTVRVNDHLPGRDLSITLDSDQPVVAERAMYTEDGRVATAAMGAR